MQHWWRIPLVFCFGVLFGSQILLMFVHLHTPTSNAFDVEKPIVKYIRREVAWLEDQELESEQMVKEAEKQLFKPVFNTEVVSPITAAKADEIQGEVVNIVVIAGGNKTRRIEELKAMIHSLLYFRTCPLHFLVITDSVAKNALTSFWKNLTKTEPKIKVSFYNLESSLVVLCQYPDRFYPGSRLKACLDAILQPDIEKVIVIDTDSMVLEDVRYFWDEFRNFTPEHSEANNCIGGLDLPEVTAPAIGNTIEMTVYYEQNTKFGADPDRRLGFGLNGGIVMLNLQRLRKIGWNDLWKRELAALDNSSLPTLDLGDQDVWNYMYRRMCKNHYIFPIEWNIQLCGPVLRFSFKDVYLAHGNCGLLAKRFRVFTTAWANMLKSEEHIRKATRSYFRKYLKAPLTDEDVSLLEGDFANSVDLLRGVHP
eukprot:TRINITY_DN4845_c0_g1_i2.p1 TRINITY_DN4845_c0_g1~~TRINITY_DN4845_c0_g1_i2.p1  ORF type:complete len:440 (-),score=65.45 TRINITY_DN4845_c0_g1_i2:8-1279(-)